MKRKFAVFDLDGTLIRWQLYHAIADELARQGAIDGDEYEAVTTARMHWKNREHVDSFRDYERVLVKLVDSTVNELKVSALEQACQNVINEYKDQVYTYTRDLIKDLKSKDYLLFAISASPDQIVGLVAKHYGFDDFCGSIYDAKDGLFIGFTDVLLHERKPEKLNELATKYNATWKDSIAVGDSEGDILLLSAVEQPIAFNPTKLLFEHAKKQGWKVVIERKNMVYRLEPQGGSYLLA